MNEFGGPALIWAGPLSALLSSLVWAMGSARYAVLSKRFTPFAVSIARASVAGPLFLLAAFLTARLMAPGVVASTVILLLVLGSVAASLGGAPRWRGALRVAFWGIVAMGCTALVGRIFGSIS